MRKVHEHIIQIPPFVTRDQLWNGLEKAARHPDRFVEHMEGCELLSERLIEGSRSPRRAAFSCASSMKPMNPKRRSTR